MNDARFRAGERVFGHLPVRETYTVHESRVDPLSELIAVVLSQHTSDVNSERAFDSLRARYPDWRLLVDGDGGDENLKDYPIEENSELTIRSVVNSRAVPSAAMTRWW